jgi:hypothetical protein
MDQVVDLPTIGNLARLCEFRFEIVEMRQIRIVWHIQSPNRPESRESNGLDCMHQIESLRSEHLFVGIAGIPGSGHYDKAASHKSVDFHTNRTLTTSKPFRIERITSADVHAVN